MLLGKYQIILFKQGGSGSRSLHLRGYVGIVTSLLLIGLISCNFWLWGSYMEMLNLRESVANSGRIIEDQGKQLLSMAGKIGSFAGDLSRVQQFDARLRMMMNMDKGTSEIAAIESRKGGFMNTYLPLHRQELMARKMHVFLNKLMEDVRLEEISQQDLLQALRSNQETLANIPSIWPITGFITSKFGARASPFNGKSKEFHRGLDISNRQGTPIVTTAGGTISFSGWDGSYGKSVEIRHGSGIITKYAHMQKIVVKKGQWVKRGEIIGNVGNTGRSSGPHLHYEVRVNAIPVDPMYYILE